MARKRTHTSISVTYADKARIVALQKLLEEKSGGEWPLSRIVEKGLNLLEKAIDNKLKEKE